MTSLLTKKFISEEGEKNLPNYKYSGTDHSILYKHVFSPTAQWVVDNFIPNWLAPNLITLIGFMCTLIPHVLIWQATGGSLSGPVPSGLCFLFAFGLFTYMILDNADGKQARKTKSSSPLGLLFDHGCDAMNTFVTGLSFFTVMQFGNGPVSVIAYIIAFTTFYMATWEEYYCEELILPWFNGVNEGLVGLGAMFIISGIYGNQIWLTNVAGFQLNHIVILVFGLISLVTVIGNIQKVKTKASDKFGDAIAHLSVLGYLIATCFIVSYCSTILTNSPLCRIFIYYIGLNFSKLVGIMQATHTAHVPFEQYRLSILIPTTLLNAIILINHFRGVALMNEASLIYGVTIFATIAHAHFILNIINQFCSVLGIKCFKIKDPNEKSAPLVPNEMKGT